MKKIKYNDGEPCDHPGCLNHITHPCERCKRIMCDGIVYYQEWDEMFVDETRKIKWGKDLSNEL